VARFKAFVAEQVEGRVERGVRQLDPADLGEDDVLVRVEFSSVNYKDALATIPGGQVAGTSPLVPGIDLAGEVVECGAAAGFEEGDTVLAHGYGLGVSHHGGYAEYARVPEDWVVPLPDGLSGRQAMAIGTAGYTAALSIHQLEERGLSAAAGPVLVAGATGGVGSTAVGILARRGYEVVASTGKDEPDYLRRLGAAQVISREETSASSRRPLESERWAGAIDPVGGSTLAYILRTLRRGAAVAVSGLTGGPGLETTVLPFVLRGVAVLGVDSVETPIERRRRLWQRLADDMRPAELDESITAEVDLDGLEPVLDAILAGEVRGRTVVRVSG